MQLNDPETTYHGTYLCKESSITAASSDAFSVL
jgi:hypothetical protein